MAESNDHNFLDCSFFQKVSNRFSSTLSFSGPHHHFMKEFIKGWKGINCTEDFTDVSGVFLHTFCWFIWLERNGRVFRDLARSETHIVYKISFAVGSWLLARKIFSSDKLLIWTSYYASNREPD